MLSQQHRLLVGAVEVAIYLAVQFDAGPVVIARLQDAARTLKSSNTVGLHLDSEG